MLLSAVSVLVVAQSSSEIPKELMNNHVFSSVHVSHEVLLSLQVSYIALQQCICIPEKSIWLHNEPT